MRTIFRTHSDRLTIAEAKRLLADALPREPGVDVYLESDEQGRPNWNGEMHVRQVADANIYEPHLDGDFLKACEQLDIAPRWKYRPTETGYTGDPANDDLYTITHEEFVKYAGLFDVRVEVGQRREFRRGPLVAPLIEQLRQLPVDEVVIVSEQVSAGRGGQGSTTVAEHLETLAAVDAQQSKGELTVRDAAWLLAENNSKLDVEDLIRRMMNATLHGQRLVRRPSGFRIEQGEVERDWLLVVRAAEVDAWLEQSGVDYRLSPLLGAAKSDRVPIAPEPAAATLSDGTTEGRPAMIKQDVVILFDGIKWSAEEWSRKLAAPAKWLRPARVGLGERGGAPSTWDPVAIASALIARELATEAEITEAFREKRYLEAVQAWQPKWKEHLIRQAWGK